MSHCSINLEDVGGEIAVMVRHTGGFDPESNAHKMSSQIIKFLDEHAERKEVLDPETIEESKIITAHNPGRIILAR